jgi:hypothetical protein
LGQKIFCLQGGPSFFVSLAITFLPLISKKLPLGLQDFRGIIEDGYKYVDKTRHLHLLATSGKYFFLSRPRRFGKSITVSTLHELFSGSRELFRGLWIEDQWDWSKKHPVLRVSKDPYILEFLDLPEQHRYSEMAPLLTRLA